jgi:photosystem II stability/assembly factor-like uncharacterized protein
MLWRTLVSSTDGNRLAAISLNSPDIYTSTDAGANWSTRTVPNSNGWNSISSSADGMNLAAVSWAGMHIFTSTDGGVSWTKQLASAGYKWVNIQSSANGQRLIASAARNFDNDPATNGGIFTSQDWGVTWQQHPELGDISDARVSSSADGMQLVVSQAGVWNDETSTQTDSLWRSTDGGTTWSELTHRLGPDQYYLSSVSSSADGSTIALASYSKVDAVDDGSRSGIIWLSKDSGATWEVQDAIENQYWTSLEVSNDGMNIAALGDNGYLYTTVNGGQDWVKESSLGQQYWGNMNLSGDGVKLVAQIYTEEGTTLWRGELDVSSGVPSEPQNLYTVITHDAATLKWFAPESAGGSAVSSYTVQYRVSGVNAQWTTIDTVTGTSQELTGLVAGQTYDLRVAAENEQGQSEFSYVESTTVSHTNVRAYTSITSSADGQKLAITTDGGYIYTSTDAGVSWQTRESAGVRNWLAIDSSSDGTQLIAAAGQNTDFVFVSTDSGATWAPQVQLGRGAWKDVAMSDDGAVMLATSSEGSGLGSVYASRDFGATWTVDFQTYINNPAAIAVSGNGATTASVQNGYYLAVGSNGSALDYKLNAGNRYWGAVAASYDGTHLVAASQQLGATPSGYIYTSSDSGETWTNRTAGLGSRYWTSTATSADASYVVATTNTGDIYVSPNNGGVWTNRSPAGQYNWTSVAMDEDGTRAVAVSSQGFIYTSDNAGVTWTEQHILDNFTVPDAPRNLKVYPGTTDVELSWDLWNDGGTNIVNYRVEYSGDNGASWDVFDRPESQKTETYARIEDLTIGTIYRFRVTAVNSVGEGPTSAIVSGGPRYISVGSSSNLNIPVIKTSDTNRMSSQASTVTSSTNEPGGYKMYISVDGDDNNLNNGEGNYFTPNEGTLDDPLSLTAGSWGYRIDGRGGFGGSTLAETNKLTSSFNWAGVPTQGNAQLIDNVSGPMTNRSMQVWYGMMVAPNQPAGTYRATVLYTVIPNDDGSQSVN